MSRSLGSVTLKLSSTYLSVILALRYKSIDLGMVVKYVSKARFPTRQHVVDNIIWSPHKRILSVNLCVEATALRALTFQHSCLFNRFLVTFGSFGERTGGHVEEERTGGYV
jgi:hypothetical protein